MTALKKLLLALCCVAIFIVSTAAASYIYRVIINSRGQMSYFTGKKMDYVNWLRDGYVYHIDDDSGLKPRSGVVNDALLYLAIGPDVQSAFADGETVKNAYRDQMREDKHRYLPFLQADAEQIHIRKKSVTFNINV